MRHDRHDFWVASLTAALLAGCAGSTPNGGQNGDDQPDDGADGAAVEAFLPADITLDIDELPSDEDSAKIVPRDDVDPSGHRSSTRLTTNVIVAFQTLAARAMAVGASIREDLTNAAQAQVEAGFDIDGVEVGYKADFAAFDMDGDGFVEGSGSATEEPVAIRVWVNRGAGYERFFCALVTVRPSTDNIGAGTLMVRPAAVIDTAADDLQVLAQWDRTEADHRWNEAVIEGPLRQDTVITSARASVDVRDYSDGSMEKTVRLSGNLAVNPYGFTTFAAAAHYRRGGEGLLLSALASGGVFPIIFSNVCVNILTQALAIGGECGGFDLQDMNLLDAPAIGDAAFPADFPEAPTF